MKSEKITKIVNGFAKWFWTTIVIPILLSFVNKIGSSKPLIITIIIVAIIAIEVISVIAAAIISLYEKSNNKVNDINININKINNTLGALKTKDESLDNKINELQRELSKEIDERRYNFSAALSFQNNFSQQSNYQNHLDFKKSQSDFEANL